MHGVGDHPQEHGKPTSGHILKREWFFLPWQLSTDNSFSVAVRAWRSSTPSLMRLLLVWSCIGLVQVSTTVESSPSQQPCYMEMTAFHSTPPHPLALHFMSQCWWLDLGGVLYRAEHSLRLILGTLTNCTPLHWLLSTQKRSLSEQVESSPNLWA